MYESEETSRGFKELLDRTNPHMTSIVSPERRLAARQVVRIRVHGTATTLGRDDPESTRWSPFWREIYGSRPFEWGEGVAFMRIEPTSMWAYAFHPELFSELLELARVFSPSDRAGDDQKDHDGNRRDTYQQEEPAKRCGHFYPLPTLTG